MNKQGPTGHDQTERAPAMIDEGAAAWLRARPGPPRMATHTLEDLVAIHPHEENATKEDPATARAGVQEIAALDGAAQSAEIDRRIAVLKDLLNKIHQRNPLGLRNPATATPTAAADRLSDLGAPGQGGDDFARRSAMFVDESWPLRAPAQSPSTADLNAAPRVAVDEVWKLDDWSQSVSGNYCWRARRRDIVMIMAVWTMASEVSILVS